MNLYISATFFDEVVQTKTLKSEVIDLWRKSNEEVIYGENQMKKQDYSGFEFFGWLMSLRQTTRLPVHVLADAITSGF